MRVNICVHGNISPSGNTDNTLLSPLLTNISHFTLSEVNDLGLGRLSNVFKPTQCGDRNASEEMNRLTK